MATSLVVRRPELWRLFRGPMRAMFDRVAPHWETMRSPGHLLPLEAALELVEAAPRTALDLGTGTGDGALAVARRWPSARVTGVDLSEEMIAHAEAKVTGELAERVRFDVADSAALPYADAEFDLVTLLNMVPFFDEIARVTAPGGSVVLAFSRGAETPIYVPPERLRAELARRRFDTFRDVARGDGTALVARRREEG
jgi:ubiquinone/menaquinone biosynthesis C-methylase UbiE